MSEYGAETLQGLHLSPAFVFSEEFQMRLLSKHFEAFDKLRSEGFFIGEFVYNYADFNTAQSEFQLAHNVAVSAFIFVYNFTLTQKSFIHWTIERTLTLFSLQCRYQSSWR